MNHAWNQWVINYNDRRQRDFLTRLFSGFGLGDIDWREMVGLLFAGMGVVLLGIALHTLRPWRPTQRDPVVTAYDRFCRQLARRGIQRSPAEGPLDFSRRARRLRPELSTAITRITTLYLRLRYAAPAKANQTRHQQLRDLQSAVRQFKA